MENLLTEILDSNISARLFLENENKKSVLIDYCLKPQKKHKTLTACVQYFNKINDVENDLSKVYIGFNNIVINDELSNKKVREIALELAKAIDKNDTNTVKALKNKYAETKEFAQAKSFLNKKCKEVWDIYESKNIMLKAPYEAMKALGITNRPSLDILLADAIKYYEKNNTSTTATIIANILKNKNLSYTIQDIHTYLQKVYEKENIKLNINTISYLISEQNYNSEQLSKLGIDKKLRQQAFKTLTFSKKLRYIFKNALSNILQINCILLKIINNIKAFRRF